MTYINGRTGNRNTASTAQVASSPTFMMCGFLAGQTVTLNVRPPGQDPGIAFYTNATTSGYISGYTNSMATSPTHWTFDIPQNAKYMRITTHRNNIETVQIEVSQSPSAYESFVENQYTATLPDTCYGGYVDLVSGMLTITHKLYTFTGQESTGSINWKGYLVQVPDSKSANNSYVVTMCSHTNNRITGSGFWSTASEGNDIAIAGSQGGQLRFRNRNICADPSDPKLAEYQTYLQAQYAAGTPVQAVYLLETPETYQLTPQMLKTLRGVNNIWSNDGDIEVTYPLNETKDIIVTKKRIIALQPHIATVTGNPVSFHTNLGIKPAELVLSIVPKHSRSGTPAPDNVIPISMYNQISLTVNGITNTIPLPSGTNFYGANIDLTGTPASWPVTMTHLEYVTSWSSASSRVTSIATLGSYTRFWFYHGVKDRKKGLVPICDMLPSAASEGYGEYNQQKCVIGCSDSYLTSVWMIMPTALVGTTADSIIQYLYNTPMTFAYEVDATEQKFITPTFPITLQSGQNMISSDVNDGMTIKYWTY